jgi:hypothetical protein
MSVSNYSDIREVVACFRVVDCGSKLRPRHWRADIDRAARGFDPDRFRLTEIPNPCMISDNPTA